ncbi:phage tail protein [Luteolibacter soli]|uniref:Phage tail protein n=1 Tax=Luteolibacter soli TaxID=3135280 RepID=A0ABU9AZ40_9BACT
MRSHEPIPYLPPGVRAEIGHPGFPWSPHRPPCLGGIGEAIVAIVSYIVEYAAVVEAVVAVASIAYSLKQANDQRKEALQDQFNSIQRNARRNFRQPLTPRRTIFGRARVGGPLIFAHNRIGFETHLLVALAGHEVQEIESVWMFDEQLSYSVIPGETFGRVAGKYGKTIILWTFKGTPTQDIGNQMRNALDPRNTPNLGDPIGIPDVIETTDKFHGIAAIYAVTKAFSVSWEGQSPEFSAIVKGAKIYDTRSSSTAWSRNPALQARHYLVTKMGVDPANIDTPTLNASANVCDQDVPLKGGGSEKRYRGDGVFTADQPHDEVLKTLEQAMAGKIRYSSGTWFIEAGAPKEADADTPHFTEAMVQGAYELNFDQPDRAFPNAVRGNFFDEADWQPASFPQYEDTSAIAAEGNTNWLDIDLPLTISYTAAQRIARIALRRARFRRTLSINLDLRGLLVRPGDLCKYTSLEIGLDATVFEVDGFTFLRDGDKFLTRLDLIEYDPSIYEWDADTDELDINRGNGALASIRSRGVKNPQWEMTTPPNPADIIANHRINAGYTITWEPPEYTESELQKVELTVKTYVTTTDGSSLFNYTSTATYTATITNGSLSRAFNSTSVVFPSGEIAVDYGVADVSIIQAFFKNNLIGPEQGIEKLPP